MSEPPSLRSIRVPKGFTQRKLGKALDEYLHRSTGETYQQKKIARFEARAAKPTEQEVEAMAHILDVDRDVMRSVFESRGESYDAAPLIDEFAAGAPEGRTLMASCILGRPRPQTLPESYRAAKNAVENKNMWMALFVPYPSAVNLPRPSHHVNNLVGYYTRVINSILEANLTFKNSLKEEKKDAVVLYVPKPELLKNSAVLIPPIFRQFTLTLQQANPPNGPIDKHLLVWTTGRDRDTGRAMKATAMYSLADQVDAWSSFFGQVIPYWIEKNEFPAADDYWIRIR
jgi:transcriptional regulator with XRE-family HTH domain